MNKQIVAIALFSVFIFFINSAKGQGIIIGSNQGKYIEVDNVKLYVEEYGEGPALLLLHGGFQSMNYFQAVVPELSKAFRVIAVDLPGHGRSYHGDSMRISLITEYLSNLIDIMKLDSVNIIGCSLGSILAIRLAAERPEKVKRIVSDAAIADTTSVMGETLAYLKIMEPETQQVFSVDAYKNKNPQGEKWDDFFLEMKKMWLSSPYIEQDAYQMIKSKVLIVMGDRDSTVKLSQSYEFYDSIEGSELAIIPDAGHCICNKKPELFLKILMDFLTKE